MSHETMKNPSRAPSAASTSSASESTNVSEQQHVLPHALRSQLGQLIPKHALFQVHVQIEQLSNVPLISGQFAVRWKFKNVQSRSGLLSKMRGNRSWSSRQKGKGRASDPGLAIEVTPAEGEPGADDDEDIGSSGEEEGTDDEGFLPTARGHSSSGDLLAGPGTAVPPVTPVPGPVHQTVSSASTATTRSVARGTTPWQPLQSYNVKWDHDVNVLVQMDVHRDTGDLLLNDLKLVVMQRVIPGDPDSPRHPRLGAVYLNLAEYADAGPVTRRYLLRESKTNATLKLTVELEYAGGAKHYRPPPLRKGEILASVTGLLSNNDLLRTSIARELDQYTHELRPHNHTFMTSDGTADGEKLASSSGLRSTEELIETLFNPLPSTRPAPSPFTYFAPTPTPRAQEHRDDASSDSLSLAQVSMRSTSSGEDRTSRVVVTVENHAVDSSPELATMEMGQGQGDGRKTWWRRKIRSRPSTPAQRAFKLPQQEGEAIRA